MEKQIKKADQTTQAPQTEGCIIALAEALAEAQKQLAIAQREAELLMRD